MDLIKLNGIAMWLTLTKVKEVHSFFSFANFYHWFILNYSTITHPLLNLTKKPTTKTGLWLVNSLSTHWNNHKPLGYT